MSRPVKTYPIDQSPLYLLSNKRKLGVILRADSRAIQDAAKSPAYTRWKTKPRFPFARSPILRAHKPREIQQPSHDLARIQRRINDLLCRIELPAYLHSARRGHSYRTNAGVHSDSERVAKVDISKFYRRADATRVRDFFRSRLKCSPDVAWIMGRLVTVDGYLPTGSPASPIVSFLAYQEMFDELHRIALTNNGCFSVYVDDVVISGEELPTDIIGQMLSVLRKYGLKGHKTSIQSKAQAPVVTGVALTSEGARLPNKRWSVIRALENEVKRTRAGIRKKKYLKSLIGQYREGAALHPSFKVLAHRHVQDLQQM